MFEGNSADMHAKKIPLVSMGGRAEREQGPPSALAKISNPPHFTAIHIQTFEIFFNSTSLVPEVAWKTC